MGIFACFHDEFHQLFIMWLKVCILKFDEVFLSVRVNDHTTFLLRFIHGVNSSFYSIIQLFYKNNCILRRTTTESLYII